MWGVCRQSQAAVWPRGQGQVGRRGIRAGAGWTRSAAWPGPQPLPSPPRSLELPRPGLVALVFEALCRQIPEPRPIPTVPVRLASVFPVHKRILVSSPS